MTQKKIPQKKDLKDERLNKLQRRVKRLEKENSLLRSEIKTLEAYRLKTNTYIDEELDGVPVEDVIKSVEKKLTLKKVKEKDKHKCNACGNMSLKIMPILNGELNLCGDCGFRKVIKDEQ
jgi:predicted nuclease with TOPRIM domain